MRIRAVSVFEGVVYHCWPVDRASPCRPQLEVEAVLRPGDADAEAGPLLLTVADYIAMVGDLDVARPCLEQLSAKGRIVSHLGADHLSFPTWSRIGPGDTPGEPDLAVVAPIPLEGEGGETRDPGADDHPAAGDEERQAPQRGGHLRAVPAPDDEDPS